MHVHGSYQLGSQDPVVQIFDRSSRTGSTGEMSQISWAELCDLPQYVRVVENMDPVKSWRQSHSLSTRMEIMTKGSVTSA
jgi:hypothetical protein